MAPIRGIARPLLAALFVWGGIDEIRHPKDKLDLADRLLRQLRVDQDPGSVVRAHGAVEVVAGSTLALGIAPRLSALTLLGALVPTTVAGHPFWEEEEPSTRGAQQVQFLKNLAIVGGLLLAAVDTAGRPSVGWWARRAAARGVERVEHLVPGRD
ncbi:MAG TPA: DoxX family protein [Acidimicrobiales bacterium]|nr:DoxX family protein [Acidimicrobiales bacterium]